MPAASVPRPPTWRRLGMPGSRFPTASASTPRPIGCSSTRSIWKPSARGAFRVRGSGGGAAARAADEARAARAADRPDAVLTPLLEAWRDLVARTGGADRRAIVGPCRRSLRLQLRRAVRKLSGPRGRIRISDRRSRVLGRALVDAGAALHGDARSRPRGHRDGGAHAAARPCPSVRRRVEPDGRRRDARQRDVGTRLVDRAGRSDARSLRAQPGRRAAAGRHRPERPQRRVRPSPGAGNRGRVVGARGRAVPRSSPGARDRGVCCGGPRTWWARPSKSNGRSTNERVQAAAGAAAASAGRRTCPTRSGCSIRA